MYNVYHKYAYGFLLCISMVILDLWWSVWLTNTLYHFTTIGPFYWSIHVWKGEKRSSKSFTTATTWYLQQHAQKYLTNRITWASYQIRKIAGCACAGNAGNVFPRRRFQRKSLINDPGMHHGTCVPHVPWCMLGSFTCGDGENVPGIPGACAPAILRIWQEAHTPASADAGFIVLHLHGSSTSYPLYFRCDASTNFTTGIYALFTLFINHTSPGMVVFL